MQFKSTILNPGEIISSSPYSSAAESTTLFSPMDVIKCISSHANPKRSAEPQTRRLKDKRLKGSFPSMLLYQNSRNLSGWPLLDFLINHLTETLREYDMTSKSLMKTYLCFEIISPFITWNQLKDAICI